MPQNRIFSLQSDEETNNKGRESTGGAVRPDQKVFGNSTDDAKAKVVSRPELLKIGDDYLLITERVLREGCPGFCRESRTRRRMQRTSVLVCGSVWFRALVGMKIFLHVVRDNRTNAFTCHRTPYFALTCWPSHKCPWLTPFLPMFTSSPSPPSSPSRRLWPRRSIP